MPFSTVSLVDLFFGWCSFVCFQKFQRQNPFFVWTPLKTPLICCTATTNPSQHCFRTIWLPADFGRKVAVSELSQLWSPETFGKPSVVVVSPALCCASVWCRQCPHPWAECPQTFERVPKTNIHFQVSRRTVVKNQPSMSLRGFQFDV